MPCTLIDEAAYAVDRSEGGRGMALAFCCRKLSGRTVVHRVATWDEPDAVGGFAMLTILVNPERVEVEGGG
jgi:hypothetical protein